MWKGLLGTTGIFAAVYGVIFAVVFVEAIPQINRMQRIADDTGTTMGNWTNKDCARHGSRSYSFSVNDLTFTSRGPGGTVSWTDCAEVQVGAPIKVFYENGDPSNNSGIEPSIVIKNQRYSVVTVPAFAAPIFLLFILLARRRR